MASVVPGIYRIAAYLQPSGQLLVVFLAVQCLVLITSYHIKTDPYTHGHGMSKVVIFGRRNAIFDDEDAIYLPQPDSVLYININPTAAAAFRGVAIVVG